MFKKLVDRLPDLDVESYYESTMMDFTRESAWGQVWDIESLACHVPRREDALIVDLGTGDGRIVKRLHDAGVKAEFIGVDNSEFAGLRFAARQEEFGFPGTFVHADFLNGLNLGRAADAIVFGSVSINCLHSIELLSRLFHLSEQLLAPNGKLVVSVYTDDSAVGFLELDGVLDVSPYVTASGVHRLMWRGLRYRPGEFLHNAFVDRSQEGLSSVICKERERVWFESEVTELAGIMGWCVDKRTESAVPDGGAEGFRVATLSFRLELPRVDS